MVNDIPGPHHPTCCLSDKPTPRAVLCVLDAMAVADGRFLMQVTYQGADCRVFLDCALAGQTFRR